MCNLLCLSLKGPPSSQSWIALSVWLQKNTNIRLCSSAVLKSQTCRKSKQLLLSKKKPWNLLPLFITHEGMVTVQITATQHVPSDLHVQYMSFQSGGSQGGGVLRHQWVSVWKVRMLLHIWYVASASSGHELFPYYSPWALFEPRHAQRETQRKSRDSEPKPLKTGRGTAAGSACNHYLV